jgi:hypothetical protein
MPRSRKTQSKRFQIRVDEPEVDVSADLNSLVDLVNTRSWDDIVLCLCTVLKLPGMFYSIFSLRKSTHHKMAQSLGLNSRSGLKQVHADFDNIQNKLEDAYIKHGHDARVAGGLVCAWATMCIDVVLRNKFLERGE